MEETKFTIIVSILLILIISILFRLIAILPACHVGKHVNNKDDIFVMKNSKKMMILLGSGGHTGEMIRILEQCNNMMKNLNREYIISSGDSTSILKLKKMEESLTDNNKDNKDKYKITTIYRARNIGEGKFKAIINTLISFKSTIDNLLFNGNNYPDVFLTNGPGTAIPIAYILFILKFLGFTKTKIIYIESLARVNQLSLTGLLILPISDRIIVQWEPLAKRYRRCEYYGILV
ncbi:UDP-N-acetylglucosamine transferase subunit [Pichia californica]|uniref:UDP-N-acetylglucosamine transferase subunit ALG14 n=1 Tax=Pichia californica TaxID=460514 RepID=A0A9P6WR58_9ASCO|nr:UDP-N-acetylglucosamine transferase subunit [[Candida] californica]KAG0690913.1 UDP-N-acetylglucosamine transferase subunit [[Candida] californica]